MIEKKKKKELGENFRILVCYFSTQYETGQDSGLNGKSRQRSISISANQIREFGSSLHDLGTQYYLEGKKKLTAPYGSKST